MMGRPTRADIVAACERLRELPTRERRDAAYWLGLAYQRKRYGRYVYVHAGAPDMPYEAGLRLYVGSWGRSTNSAHSDVLVGIDDHLTWLGAERLWKLLRACG